MRLLRPFLFTRELPAETRRHYAVEVRHLLGWGIFAGVVEGNTSLVVAYKTFHASELLASVLYTTPMVANILALSLSALSRGRPRVPTFVFFAAIATVLLASVAAVPETVGDWAGWIFAAQIALVRIFVAGLITLRTTLWLVHYPQAHRAKIAGRLQSLRFFMGLLAGAGVAILFDEHAQYFRYVYPGVAVIGALSLVPMRNWRENAQDYTRGLQTADSGRAPCDDSAPVPSVTVDTDGQFVPAGPRAGFFASLHEAWMILRTDRAFARYCRAQYIMGSAAFFIDRLIVQFVSKQLGFGYLAANLILDGFPRIVTLFSISPFAHQFDRVGVLQFRVMNSAIWLVSYALTTAAVAILSAGVVTSFVHSDAWMKGPTLNDLWMTPGTAFAQFVQYASAPGVGLTIAGIALLLVSRFVVGLGQGGGSIAWNLGHLHFTRGHNAELYMGVHVALTGIRGVTKPFIAALLYQWIGWYTYLVAIVLGVVALISFARLARDAAPRDPVAPTAEPVGADASRRA